ncbi:MAG TPA: hemolysin III family protein [Methylibium sp.]|nr:hemolysin III family protein [Methylibium sp.]
MDSVDRPQSRGEEFANAASHALGLLLALGSLPVLLDLVARRGPELHRFGVGVFAATMILLYFASALYHALPPGRLKGWCQTLDHAAIFLFIAGSYTPFMLGPMPPASGRPLLAAVWGLALVGILLKLLRRPRSPWLSTVLYLSLAWLGLVVLGPLLRSVSAAGLAWLLAGAGAYMAGLVFFLLDGRLRYGHFVWHLFVLAGSGCHFCAAVWHAPVARALGG